MSFGVFVERRRVELGLTQKELAAKLGIHAASVYCIETRGKTPRARTIKKYCAILGPYIADPEHPENRSLPPIKNIMPAPKPIEPETKPIDDALTKRLNRIDIALNRLSKLEAIPVESDVALAKAQVTLIRVRDRYKQEIVNIEEEIRAIGRAIK